MSQARKSELQHALSGTAYSAAGAGIVAEEAKRRLYVSLDIKRRLYITLVVKQQNRKKHNSNRLFFDVFSQVCSVEHFTKLFIHFFFFPIQLCTKVNFTRYYFCTDAGTLYAPHMLCTLLGHMEANADCGACCGALRHPPSLSPPLHRKTNAKRTLLCRRTSAHYVKHRSNGS